MANSRTARFLEADLKRAIIACEKSGLRDYRVEIAPDGTISVIVGPGTTAPKRRNSMDFFSKASVRSMDDKIQPIRILTDEVSRLTGLPVRTILSMSARGEIPSAAKLGRRWSYDREKVVTWIADREADVAERSGRPRPPTFRPQVVPPPGGASNPLRQAVEERLARSKK